MLQENKTLVRDFVEAVNTQDWPRVLALAIYRIENGRIAEAWAEWDNLAGLRQLGHAREI